MGTEEIRTLDQAVAELRVEMRGSLEALRADVARLGTDLQPIVKERSGDERRLDQLEKDVKAAHDKHRIHFERVSELRDRIDRQRDEVLEDVKSTRSGLEHELQELSKRLTRVETRVAVIVTLATAAWALAQQFLPLGAG